MEIALYIALTIGTFVFMEGTAWFTHKYIMHGFLWYLHKDHHEPHDHTFEKNDWFFLIFAVPGILLLYFGSLHSGFNLLFSVGLGITLYGFCYFFVHDIFIHRRMKILRNTNSAYFRALRKAHKVHHKHQGKRRAENFGMLFVPMHYFKTAIRQKNSK